MSITENLKLLKAKLRPHVALVAVSKTRTIAEIEEAIRAGQQDFGENRAEELAVRAPLLPAGLRWHFIGHLQRKKVKKVVPFAALIHSVDSLALLEEINKRAAALGKVQDCLLQVRIAQEETKGGLSPLQAEELLLSPALAGLDAVKISGLMGMATFTDDQQQIRSEFRSLKHLFDKASSPESHVSHLNTQISILSMGMSADWPIALAEGSNMLRIGSAVFGERK